LLGDRIPYLSGGQGPKDVVAATGDVFHDLRPQLLVAAARRRKSDAISRAHDGGTHGDIGYWCNHQCS
jgi:hypothetical protein